VVKRSPEEEIVPTPSSAIVALLTTFAPAFTAPTFAHAQVLVYGTLPAVGRRTVTAALRAVGLAEERHFTTDHRLLNRAVWSPLTLSRLLLGLLVVVLSNAGDNSLTSAPLSWLARISGGTSGPSGCR